MGITLGTNSPSAHGPKVSATVPFELKLLLVRLVTSTGSAPNERICLTMVVKFLPIESGVAIFWSLCPNWMVTSVRRPRETSPLIAARDAFQYLVVTIQYPSFFFFFSTPNNDRGEGAEKKRQQKRCLPIGNERASCCTVMSSVDTRSTSL